MICLDKPFSLRLLDENDPRLFFICFFICFLFVFFFYCFFYLFFLFVFCSKLKTYNTILFSKCNFFKKIFFFFHTKYLFLKKKKTGLQKGGMPFENRVGYSLLLSFGPDTSWELLFSEKAKLAKWGGFYFFLKKKNH